MAATTRKGLKRKYVEKVADNEKVLDETDSEMNSDIVEDVEIITKKRRKQPKKLNRRVTVSESSDNSLDFTKRDSPPQILKSNTVESTSTPPSNLCQDDINSLKNYINETIEQNCKPLSVKLSQLTSMMVDIKATLNELLGRSIDHKSTNNSCDVISDFNEIWKLPCQTVEDFKIFDEKIGKEIDVRKKLAHKFISIINKRTTIVRNMSEILRYCLSREVALRCNAFVFMLIDFDEIFSMCITTTKYI
ncbi:uncharacterized protein LOC143218332 [Lasioglossum baleicum]|uniref:uncharacterized protein LOC143218332 n=1 Tax=Lasioglossum baleicum TaxID=434251 RepID=UPI003FCEBA70